MVLQRQYLKTVKEFTKSVDAYRKAFQKYLAVHDGRVLREFEKLYDALHRAGYYRGFRKI